MNLKRGQADDAHAVVIATKAIKAWQAFVPIHQALKLRKLDIDTFLYAKRTRLGFLGLMKGVYKSKALDCSMREVVVGVAERIIRSTWQTWKDRCIRRQATRQRDEEIYEYAEAAHRQIWLPYFFQVWKDFQHHRRAQHYVIKSVNAHYELALQKRMLQRMKNFVSKQSETRMKTANAYLHAINASTRRHLNTWLLYHQRVQHGENNIYKALNFWSKRLNTTAVKHWKAHHEICIQGRVEEKLAYQARQGDLAKSCMEHWLKVGIKFSEISEQENYAKMQSKKAKEIGLAYKFGMRWIRKVRANKEQRRVLLSPYKAKASGYSPSPVQGRTSPNKPPQTIPKHKSPITSP